MPTPLPSEPLYLALSASTNFGRGVRLDRESERGALHRIARGSYVDAEVWRTSSIAEQYRARVGALARRRASSAVISHQSAAAFYGLPSLAPWPREVHLTVGARSNARSTTDVRVHRVDVDERDVVEHEGLLITGFERTLVDNAASLDLMSAVGMIDRAIAVDRFGRRRPMTTRHALHAVLDRSLPFRRSVRAASVIAFASELSGSPLESASRVNMALAGFPPPELQRTFLIEGTEYDSDFYWECIDGIGECDGREKYFAPVLTRGRSIQQIFWDEKQREDRLRSRVRRFTRWDFATGLSQAKLTTRLRDLGLPQTGRPPFRG